MILIQIILLFSTRQQPGYEVSARAEISPRKFKLIFSAFVIMNVERPIRNTVNQQAA